ncbi:hypothetical protein CCHR01_14592 [Colletotrichum chrysophilum]|uniref:Uncharacterized protein n=1 Tax=Colletotrichum chrysophilum TaxID=1836956 RepID=A0AAD9E9F6_9PEZI|nr:hypothetical protein CCHR01_14592 [Colletotrichum chrysophilum]
MSLFPSRSRLKPAGFSVPPRATLPQLATRVWVVPRWRLAWYLVSAKEESGNCLVYKYAHGRLAAAVQKDDGNRTSLMDVPRTLSCPGCRHRRLLLVAVPTPYLGLT